MKKHLAEYQLFHDLAHSLASHPTNSTPLGTVYMRTLASLRPALAERIKNTIHDPSGRDKIHYLIEDFVARNWDTISG